MCANRALSEQVEHERLRYTAEARFIPPSSNRPDRQYGYRTTRAARRVHPYGAMRVIDTMDYGQLRFECYCGWRGWNVQNPKAGNVSCSGWGPAGEHAKVCPFSDKKP